ncbi:hypothetical protein LXL04_020410 [Taraxacum kok-saghyz]
MPCSESRCVEEDVANEKNTSSSSVMRREIDGDDSVEEEKEHGEMVASASFFADFASVSKPLIKFTLPSSPTLTYAEPFSCKSSPEIVPRCIRFLSFSDFSASILSIQVLIFSQGASPISQVTMSIFDFTYILTVSISLLIYWLSCFIAANMDHIEAINLHSIICTFFRSNKSVLELGFRRSMDSTYEEKWMWRLHTSFSLLMSKMQRSQQMQRSRRHPSLHISGVVRSSSPIHPNHITPGLNRQGRLLGEVSGSSLTNNLPCRFKPGVIWLGCIGLLDLTTPEILSISGVVRSSSSIHPNHITPGLNRKGRLLVRLEPETSPFNAHYLYRVRFIIYSDHRRVQILFGQQDLNNETNQKSCWINVYDCKFNTTPSIELLLPEPRLLHSGTRRLVTVSYPFAVEISDYAFIVLMYVEGSRDTVTNDWAEMLLPLFRVVTYPLYSYPSFRIIGQIQKYLQQSEGGLSSDAANT